MRLRGRRVGDLRAKDVAALLDSKAPESKTLEYKRDLPGNNDEARKEFLADVSAMANTAGGVILFGIDEERDAEGKTTGVPIAPPHGLGQLNADEVKRNILERLQSGLNPRISEPAIQVIDVGAKTILALGVARSLYAPHAVWFQKSGKFFRRHDAGKYQVDPAELKAMFLESDEWEAAAERLRRDRYQKAKVPIVTGFYPKWLTMTHILPLGRLREQADIFRDNNADFAQKFRSPGMMVGDIRNRSNFDGFLLYNVRADPLCPAYMQVLRCGGFEYVTSKLHTDHKDGRPIVYNVPGLEKDLSEFVPKALKVMTNRWGLEPPFAILLTIDGDGLRFLIPEDLRLLVSETTIQQSEPFYPALIVSHDNAEDPDLLRPLLEMVLQSTGRY